MRRVGVPAEGRGGLSTLGGGEVSGDDERLGATVRCRGYGLIEGGAAPDVVLPGEGVSRGNVRERDGLRRRGQVERRRVDPEALEGVSERDHVSEGEHDGDLAGRVGGVAETEAAQKPLEFASECGVAQGRGA